MSSPEQWTRPQSGAGSAATAAQPSPEQVIAGLRATTEGGAELTQLLNPEGERLPSPEFDPYVADIDAEALRGLYRDMVLVRRGDREGNALQRQGQLGIWVPLLGQEAAQIGAGRALKPQDMAFPVLPRTRRRLVPRGRPHRAAWHLPRHRPLRLGLRPPQVPPLHHRDRQPGAERHRLRDGTAVRRARSATAADAEATICFFGDGATSQGDVHEGLVWAAVVRRPGGLLLPEQPVGDLRTGRAAVQGAAVAARPRLRLPRHPGRRQRRAGLPGRHPLGAGGVPHAATAR